MKTIFILLMAVQFLFAHNTTYYVSSRGNDNNSGTSTHSPFRTINKINTIDLTPGDKILFEKNSIFYDLLRIEAQGDNRNPIIIGSYGSGKLPILDGNMNQENIITITNSSYIIVQNLHIKNFKGEGGIRIKRSNNIVVENNEFYVTAHGGVLIETSNNSRISFNKFTTPTNTPLQTDGIYSQRNNNITIDNNNIIISNTNPIPHCDGIQSYLDGDMVISNNYVEQRNNKKSNAQGIYATTAKGRHTYFNNVVNCPNTGSSVIGFRNLDKGNGSLRLYNNTLISSTSNTLYVSEAPDVEIKNNIFYSKGSSAAIHIANSVRNYGNIDYNFYNRSGRNALVEHAQRGNSKSIDEWKNLGADKNSIFEITDLDSDFRIKSKFIKNKGTDNVPYVKHDKAGKERLKDRKVDIGAYEHD